MQMATQATSIFDGDAAGGSVKDTVAAFNVATSLDVMPCKSMSLARILVNCCAETDEVVKQVLLCPLGVWCEHNKRVFDKAAGELIGVLRSYGQDPRHRYAPTCPTVLRSRESL